MSAGRGWFRRFYQQGLQVSTLVRVYEAGQTRSAAPSAMGASLFEATVARRARVKLLKQARQASAKRAAAWAPGGGAFRTGPAQQKAGGVRLGRQAFLAQAEQMPLAATFLPGNTPQLPEVSPALAA